MGVSQPGAPDLAAWAQVSGRLPWQPPPDPLWSPGPRQGRWFQGGRLDVATVCAGVWARHTPTQVAVEWEGEPGDRRSITYAALADEVGALARGLRGLGLAPGDVVALHLGLLPETVVAMLACARVGAVHAVVPTPLPPDALADRLAALGARVLLTQDGAWRRGTVLPLKARADEALAATTGVEHTVVVRRTGIDVAWFEGDRWYHDLVATARPGQARDDDAAVARPAEHPVLLVSQAYRRGRPVTVSLGAAALVCSALALHDGGIADGSVTWCVGDVSWLGTQAHGIYGPLAAGATAVLYEGTLDVPTHARAWEILRRYAVSTLLTTPSVLRSMRTWSVERDATTRAPSLRRVVAFGEPMDEELRSWAATGLAGAVVSVADGWGQVELGGIVHLDRPVDPHRMPDIGAVLLDADGSAVPEGQVGELALTRSWAGAMLGVVGSPEPAPDGHWSGPPGVYLSGDRARRRADGSLEFLGRTDEVVSVSGMLVSLGEVRAVLLEHPYVAAADVIERRDPRRGRILAAAVVLGPEAAGVDPASVVRDLGRSVHETLGGLARPRLVVVVDRFGDELRGDERRRALALLPVGDPTQPARATWEQVLAAARVAD